jgi:hypothetical protein
MKRHANPILAEYVFIFAYSLLKQLESDGEVYGEEWRKTPREGQEDRIYSRIEQYWVDFSRCGVPIPWLKIAALALIAWMRDHYPEHLIRTYVDPD